MQSDPPSSQEDLFAAAAALAREERSAFLERHCSGQPELRAELESLLRAHDAAEGFLSGPAISAQLQMGASDAGVDHVSHPDRIGAYAIRGVLGVGGMGTVYLARQEGTSRDVALKVMRAGYASASMRRRFEQEARMLARLHHPGIAQIYEAGIADVGGGPQPFFAMELVTGSPLNTYARAEDLDIRQRLELAAAIADAVDHAHSRGIVHRDLKPANVLVDREGRPRVLDFGVARATTSDIAVTTLHTQPGQLIGTLAYMSPEQITGDPDSIDGRCDVYALGVMLYELLSGRLPHESSSTPLPEMLRRIREDEASPLGTLDGSLRGDIETIVRKAMEKDPGSRYASAQALADDIRRYLRDEVILAHPPSLIEQARKFTRRNRALVTATAAVFAALVLLVVGVSASLVRAREAERAAVRQSENARREAAHARAVSRFLQEMLAGVDPAVARTADTTLLRQILDTAANRVHELEDMPEVESAVRIAIGGTYMFAGLHPAAEEHLLRAHSLRRAALGDDDPASLEAANRLAVLRHLQGQFDEAERLYDSVLASRRAARGSDDQLTLESVNNLGALYLELDRRAEAEPLCLEAVEGRKRVLGGDHPKTLESMNNLGALYWRQGRYADVEPLWTHVLETRRGALGEEHPETLTSMNNLALLYLETQRAEEAELMFVEVLEKRRRITGPEHPETLKSMLNLAQAMHRHGRIAEAELLYEELLEIQSRVLGEGHLSTLLLLSNIGSLHLSQGRPEQAEAALNRAVEAARVSLPNGHAHVASFLTSRAVTRAAQERYAEAEADLIEAHAMLEPLVDPGDGRLRWTMEMLAAVYEAWGRKEEAAAWRARLGGEPAQPVPGHKG